MRGDQFVLDVWSRERGLFASLGNKADERICEKSPPWRTGKCNAHTGWARPGFGVKGLAAGTLAPMFLGAGRTAAQRICYTLPTNMWCVEPGEGTGLAA